MKNMIVIAAIVAFVIFFSSSFSTCSRRQNVYRDQYDVTVNQMQLAADGLDLQAVGSLLKTTKTAEDLERQLNDSSVGINNMDLDEDGQVDYLKVTEFGSGAARGFSLTTELTGGEEQEVATVTVEKRDEEAYVEVQGNRSIYGNNHYYGSSFGLTDFLLFSYLFSSHRPWSSPWGYNRYPPSYDRYGTRPSQTYQRTASNMRGSSWNRSGSSSTQAQLSSPNAGKNATSVKAPLAQPTQSQKAFQARNPSKQARSGGFGRTGSTSSRPTVRSSSSSRGGGSFGGK